MICPAHFFGTHFIRGKISFLGLLSQARGAGNFPSHVHLTCHALCPTQCKKWVFFQRSELQTLQKKKQKQETEKFNMFFVHKKFSHGRISSKGGSIGRVAGPLPSQYKKQGPPPQGWAPGSKNENITASGPPETLYKPFGDLLGRGLLRRPQIIKLKQ